MKRFIISIIGLLFVIGLSACTFSNPQNNNKTTDSGSAQQNIDGFLSYHNETTKFSIQYPQDWKLQEKNQGSHIILLSPQNQKDSFRTNISVVTKKLNKGMSLDNYYDISKPDLLKFINNFKEISNKNIRINTFDAKKIEFEGEQGIYKLKRQQILFIKNQTVYLITYTASINNFDKYIKIFKKMIESISIN